MIVSLLARFALSLFPTQESSELAQLTLVIGEGSIIVLVPSLAFLQVFDAGVG